MTGLDDLKKYKQTDRNLNSTLTPVFLNSDLTLNFLLKVCRLLHINLFAKCRLAELFDKRKPDFGISPQLRLSLVRS